MSIVLLGIGNPLHADDGAGPKLADMLAGTPGVTAFNCGTAPENFTGLVRKLEPDLLIIADAADMGLAPGSIRVIPPEKIRDTSIDTHTLPLYHLVDFLAEPSRKIVVIGIQPASLDWTENLSEQVESVLNELKVMIAENTLLKIPVL